MGIKLNANIQSQTQPNSIELRYILDPKEVHGKDFSGETFRVLKEKEVKQFGEYRTRRLVLEAWDAQGQG